MTWIKKDTDDVGRSYNFVAPADTAMSAKQEVLFPMHQKQTPDYAATLAVSIKHMETFLQPAELTGAVTINLTVDAQVTPGAKLYIKLDADGTNRVATMGTGFDAAAPAVTVTADTVKFLTYVYDGTAFVPAN